MSPQSLTRPVSGKSRSRAVQRRVMDHLATGMSWCATFIVVFVLGSILWTLIKNGLPGLSLTLFTHSMGAPGAGGGWPTPLLAACCRQGWPFCWARLPGC